MTLRPTVGLLYACALLTILFALPSACSAQESKIARAQDTQVRLASTRTPLPKPTSIPSTHGRSGIQLENAQPSKTSSASVLGTMFALGVALTLFLGVAFMLKRLSPNAGRKQLPREALEVIATTELAPKQQWMLIRFGNKLILVCQHPGQTQVISEVTDQKEIQNLLSLCEKPHPEDAAFPAFSLTNLIRTDRRAIG